MSEKLHIEKQYSYPGMDTFLVTGFSPDEMDNILRSETWEKQRDLLADLLCKYENNTHYGTSIGKVWKCGCGIYGIRHFGGNLLVTVGSSCD